MCASRSEGVARHRLGTRFLVATALSTVGGLILRLQELTTGLLDLDEAYTLILARQPVERILSLAPTDANPPLASLAYRGWIHLFGDSEPAWELLAVVAGTVTIPLLALAGTIAFDRRTGAIAGALLAFSPLHVELSQLVRGYALALLFAVVAVGALLYSMRSRQQRHAVAFVVAAWLLLATHYYGVLVASAMLVGVALAELGRGEELRRVAAMGAALAALASPLLAMLWVQYTRYRSFDWIPSPRLDFVEVTVRLAGSPMLAIVSIAASAAAALQAVQRRQTRGATVVLLSWLVFPWLLAVAISFVGPPFFSPRYAALWLPPWLLLTARGLAVVRARGASLLALAVLAGLSISPLRALFAEVEGSAVEKSALQELEQRFRPGDTVLHLGKESWAPAWIYHRGALPERFLAGTPTSNVMRYWLEESPELAVEDLPGGRAWVHVSPRVLLNQGYAGLQALEAGLERRGARLVEASHSGILRRYEVPRQEGRALRR